MRSLVGAIMSLAMFIGAVGDPSPPLRGASPESPELRVMSFNLRYDTAADGPNRWSERRELVAATISAFHPDLLGVQECLASQADWLRGQLPDHEFIGVGRDDGKRAGEMTAVFFKRDRFETLDAGHIWLSATPEVPGSVGWDAKLTRMATWVKLRDRRAPDRTVCFWNAHFDHRGETARLESAKLLRRSAARIGTGGPIIIAGDFNAPAEPDGAVYRALLNNAGDDDRRLIDTYRAAHPEPSEDEGTFNGFEGRTAGPRIDWIVASEDLVIVDAAIVREHEEGRYPSDHFPVTAVMRFR